MSSPFFSIILPTYNRANLIGKPINSVLEQSFGDWELIIVDDGSTDNTRDTVLSFKDERIKYIYQDNAERSAARNKGITQSRGLYICFLDSDDYYLNNHLSGLHELIESLNEPQAMFVTDVIRNEMGKLVPIAHEEATKFKNNICYILCANESIIPPRVAIHREILEKYRFDVNLNVSEDSDLWVNILAHFPLYQTNEATVVYSIHEFNSTNKMYNPYASQLIALKKIFGTPGLLPFIPRRIKNAKLSSCYYGIAQYYERNKQFLRMSWYLLKSLTFDPVSPATKSKIYMMAAHFPEIFYSRTGKNQVN